MLVAKGKSSPDGTYIYTCGTCDGRGCTDCYGGDTEKILAAMNAGARGQHYYALLKAFLSVKGRAMVESFHRVKAENGGTITPVDLGYITSLHGLNFKATVEWLEETGCVRVGTHRQIIESRGLTVRRIMDAARDKYPTT